MGVRNGVVLASDTTGSAPDASSVDNHERTTNGIGGADRNTHVALSAIALNHLRPPVQTTDAYLDDAAPLEVDRSG